MKDRTLLCKDCLQEFVWTVGEQEFYAQKNLDQPKYCLVCRGKYQADQKFKSQYSSGEHDGN